jgi:hypothetical protein
MDLPYESNIFLCNRYRIFFNNSVLNFCSYKNMNEIWAISILQNINYYSNQIN